MVMRLTASTRAVLEEFLVDPHAELHGYEIMQSSGLRSGTTYPILKRLAEAGWMTVRLEESGEHAGDRPPRRYYRLTDTGRREAAKVTAGPRPKPKLSKALGGLRVAMDKIADAEEAITTAARVPSQYAEELGQMAIVLRSMDHRLMQLFDLMKEKEKET